ncbi:alpha-galactosidase [Curtobacterium flaccumfaciens]|nr:alpha-galactosidase [Curtobacterium flaccumfaciens]
MPGFQTRTEVRAERGEHVVDFVSSFATGAFLTDSGVTVDELSLLHADNDWAAESRWRTDPLRSIGLARIDREAQHHPPRSRAVVQNRGSWSTGEALPIGVLDAASTAYSLVWQVEHNGPWLSELGETRRHAYLLLSGPTDQEHQWTTVVAPDRPFVSVPVSVGIASSVGGAFEVLTAQRRARRSLRPVDASMPLVFNDYMNTLMGDPTTEKLLPLIDAASDAGADLFCIDAGWYAEGHWWDTVGAWEPAASRFSTGLEFVIGHIRSRGMQAGLWLEPEVIGIHSPLASSLPSSAFVHHHGVRVAEHGRHLLDLCSAEARAHLDAVVDRLVGSLGVSFFKMDYNTMTGPFSGSLEHSRALLDWLDDVQARYPALLIENCASGAMRADAAMLSRLHLQSTSDQQDPVLYASIAAAAPAAMLPEQAGNWAYPAPSMSEDLFTLSLVNGVLGRMYLSGYLSSMSDAQRAVVGSAIAAHREVLDVVDTALPVWPLGLPGWEDTWVALGLRAASGDLYLSVWALPGLRRRCRCRCPGSQGVRCPWSRCSRRASERGRSRGTRPPGCCTSTTAGQRRRRGCSASGRRGGRGALTRAGVGWQTGPVLGLEARCGQVPRLQSGGVCVGSRRVGRGGAGGGAGRLGTTSPMSYDVGEVVLGPRRGRQRQLRRSARNQRGVSAGGRYHVEAAPSRATTAGTQKSQVGAGVARTMLTRTMPRPNQNRPKTQ